jgi:RNA polymerase sigma-70 factor (ECF subfamily)
MDERQAIARLKRGEIEGLETLVRAYQLRAVRAADLVVRDQALAEDIVQSAFLRAYERIDQLDDARPFGPWFLRSVVNSALEAVRRPAPLSLDADPGDGAGPLAGRLADRLADPGPALLERVVAAETREAIWQALGRLSAEQRAAVVLRYYLGMSEADISGTLACPPGTVKWRLHAARRRLRRLLQAFAPLARRSEKKPEVGR